MKHFFEKSVFIFSLLFLILLPSCKEEDDPTIFRGTVIFSEGTPITEGRIRITAQEAEFLAGPSIVSSQDVTLNGGNTFEIQFSAERSIDYFAISVSYPRPDGVLQVTNPGSSFPGGTSCEPFDCGELEPGRVYDDLVLVVHPAE